MTAGPAGTRVGDAPHDLLGLAVDAARAAGELITGRRPDDLGVATKTSDTDVVTVMDHAAEELIAGILRAARPGDGIVGEEGSATDAESGVRWYVDPIDGTVNYLHRLPAYCVSLAAEVGGTVVAGVVFDPVRDELFTAVRGAGAACNGSPIRCSTQPELTRALVGTGFSYVAERRARQAAVLTKVLPAVADIRRFGSAALDLCSVAAGRLDAFYEAGLQPWDLAAGGLIAAEAGARVEGLHGEAAAPGMVVAAPPQLFDALHDLLATAGAAGA